MKVDIFTFCDNAQEYKNKLVIVGTFNSIFAPKFPAVHKEMAIAVRIVWDHNDMGDYRVTFSIKKENDDVFLVKPTVIGTLQVKGIEGESLRVNNLIIKSSDIVLPSEGKYVATLSFNEQEYTSYLLIMQAQKPQ